MAQEEVNEKNREGTYDWRIERFMENSLGHIQSPLFTIGIYRCFLRLYGRNASCRNCIRCSSVYLKSLDINAFNNKTFFKLSLITLDKALLLTKRAPLSRNLSIFPLTIIEDYELLSNQADFLPEGALTLRLSWYQEEDSSELERDIQTTPIFVSEIASTKCLESLSRDFGLFYENKTDTDCVLRVGESQFPVHRHVLAARSQVFEAMFRHDTSESLSGVVDIPDVDGAVLDDVLHYIYSGQIRGLTADTAAQMYVVADKYALIEMRDICLDLLKRSLTVQNVCESALLAHLHEEVDLENKVIVFIEEKLEELEETDEWHNFSQTKPLLANKLLRSALMSSKSRKVSAK